MGAWPSACSGHCSDGFWNVGILPQHGARIPAAGRHVSTGGAQLHPFSERARAAFRTRRVWASRAQTTVFEIGKSICTRAVYGKRKRFETVPDQVSVSVPFLTWDHGVADDSRMNPS